MLLQSALKQVAKSEPTVVVSIPQAVSAIAINAEGSVFHGHKEGFNTASGKCYCNSSDVVFNVIINAIEKFQYRKR